MTFAVCHTANVTGIGERVRAARLREGWSIPDLAERVGNGCSVDTIKRFERLKDQPPKGSRYFDRTLRLLGVNLSQEALSAVDPDDPPVSMATKSQLVTRLARLIYEETASLDGGNVEPFTIRGMPVRDERNQSDETSWS